MIVLQSCTVNEVKNTQDNDTISEVFEYSNVNFTAANGYNVLLTYPHSLFTSDMVLVYRLYDFGSGGDVWKLLPETYYFNDGTLDFGYDSNFTRFDAEVSLFGLDLQTLPASNRLNQVIRVVVIPAFLGNRMTNSVDLNDYNAVINYYGINDKNIAKIKL